MGILQRRRKEERPRCAAIIVAAGNAERMHGIDKVMAELCGEPVILHTLRAFQESDWIDEIVVVTREQLIPEIRAICRESGIEKLLDIVPGGAERRDSVLAGLDRAAGSAAIAAIHDGARPLVSPEVIQAAVETAARTGAAAPAVPLKDTVKVADRGVILATPDRSRLMAVQTPQVFDLDLVRGALYKAVQDQKAVTDDCSAVEQLGMKVHLTAGSEENLKITTPLDLLLAEAILRGRRETHEDRPRV